MQQTETLKLNLIEGSDTVDPAPINENMETLEAETAAIREEMATETTAIRKEMATETTAIRQEAAAEATAIRQEMATETTAIRQEAAAEATAIRKEMASMPVQHMAIGTYTGNDGTHTFDLGFTPAAVFVRARRIDAEVCALALKDSLMYELYNTTTVLQIITNGFEVIKGANTALNNVGLTYNYLAIG